MRQTSIARSRTCTPGSTGEHIGLCRLGDITYRRLMVSSARSQLPHSKTRSSRRRPCAVLNAIYEEDFLGFSYGFRPKRSQHDALDALITGIHCTKVNYIFDADLRSFFDSVSQQWLIRFLKHRINDTRMLRLIQKWLKAGVLEDGLLTVSDRGP